MPPLRIRTGAGKDPGIALGEGASTLALKHTGDDHRPVACGASVDEIVYEVDKLVWKPNSDLLAHPKADGEYNCALRAGVG